RRTAASRRAEQDRPAAGAAVVRGRGRAHRARVPRLGYDRRRNRGAEARTVHARSPRGGRPAAGGTGARRLPRVPPAAVAARVPRLSHRERLPRHRPAARTGAARSDPEGGGSSGRRRGRGRRGDARVGVTLFGGAFDPPHVGHVELARAAKERFEVPQLVVLVSAAPAHKGVSLPPETRLELARAAFPDEDVRLDPYPRTIDLLRRER